MEISESVCVDQFVTLDSLVSSMLSENGDIILNFIIPTSLKKVLIYTTIYTDASLYGWGQFVIILYAYQVSSFLERSESVILASKLP